MKKYLSILFAVTIVSTVIIYGFYGAESVYADIFGQPGAGGSTESLLEVICASSTPASSGTLNSISVMASSSVASNLGFAVYADDGSAVGKMGAFLASSTPISTPTSKAWATSTGDMNLPITAGTIYFLCAWSDNPKGTTWYYNSSNGSAYRGSTSQITQTFDLWTKPWSASITRSAARQEAIYATYTPSAPPVESASPPDDGYYIYNDE